MSNFGKRLDNRNYLLIAGILAGIFVAPNAVRAQDAPQAHDANAIYAQTGASKEQLDKIHSIGADFEAKVGPNYNALMNAAKEMQRLSLDPNLDDAKLLATQDQINKITAEMSNERIQNLIACRKVLTQDQRVKLVELLKKRREANAAALGKPQ